ncbi:uncharacterized protein PHACADRAFT_183860 [Phanerochaete carnosa HHB-10118-sp]|uniref:C2H2-type domain-containing protein n=1 Tax=Phanerochaete carnosa (strain HHB-10118-sp) TaxID=650164 RepID=K5VU11_PHACS|nr:uncharacterized protein PHACADRAFT_183860 [Phanerochaete carnosa HHB-10118-sp]EKM54993.1 hypothetical protein PHACADRAFT_183860 [Phanerochaete carnosa HHB-10118-sp]
MAQVVNDEGHNRKDRNLAPRNVSIWRQDQEAATSFRCRTCHRQFTSQEIATLHSQMEHPSVFASHCDTQSLIESLVESVRSPGSRCIYKRTAALVANDISDLLKRNERMDIVRSTYDSLLELERLCRSASSRVALLTKTIPQRARLVELSPELPCRRGPLWEALEIDDHSILTILQLAVSCDKDEIMGLRENSAASFLTLADSVRVVPANVPV